ncbi:MAG: DUF5696 domain-containing protein [Acutalibacteraceae bacterium]
MKKKAFVAFLCAVIMLTALSGAFLPVDALGFPENENFSLSVTDEGFITVKCKKSGSVYTSNPNIGEELSGLPVMEAKSMLLVEYFNENQQISKANSYVGSVSKDGLTIKNESDGVTLTYTFPEKETDFVIPIKITLHDDRISAKILTDKITEKGSAKIIRIGLLPFFAAGSENDDGYMLIPDGCGAVINFNNGKGNYYQYEEPIYGWDQALTRTYEKTVLQMIHLPVFGIKKNNDALLAVIEEGGYDADILAQVAGSMESPYFNHVYTQFYYRKSDTIVLGGESFSPKTVVTVSAEKNDSTDFCVSYYPIYNGGYVEMAEKYSEVLGLSEGGDNKSPGLSVELIGGVEKKASFLGIPYYKYIPLTTYSQAKEILSDFTEDGIDNISVTLSGWMKNGIYSKLNFSLDADSKLGGSKGYEALEAFTEENNIRLYGNVEFQKIYKSKFGYSKRFDCIKSMGSIPLKFYSLDLATSKNDTSSELSWSLLRYDKFDKALKEYKKNEDKIGGIAVGALGNLIYSDFSKGKSCFRNEAAGKIDKVFKAIDNKNMTVASANAYALGYADRITAAPQSSSDFSVTDYDVPFYQMVIGNAIDYCTPPINLEGDTETAFLKAMQTGSSIGYTLIYEENSKIKDTVLSDMYGAGYEDWQDVIKSQFDALKEISDRKITNFIHYENGVTRTDYADGTKVYVNFSDNMMTADGVTVKPRDYSLVR